MPTDHSTVVTIELELTRAEVTYLSTCCIQRVFNSALDALPDDYDHLDDMMEAGPILERLRSKIVNELFRIKHLGI